MTLRFTDDSLPFALSRDLSTGLVWGITWIEALNGTGSEEEGNRY